ncbi:hypothetical protein ACKXSU_001358 [Neisseria gonorrhoeae]
MPADKAASGAGILKARRIGLNAFYKGVRQTRLAVGVLPQSKI